MLVRLMHLKIVIISEQVSKVNEAKYQEQYQGDSREPLVYLDGQLDQIRVVLLPLVALVQAALVA